MMSWSRMMDEVDDPDIFFCSIELKVSLELERLDPIISFCFGHAKEVEGWER